MSYAQRFFIALLPPQPIQDYANEVKQYFAFALDASNASGDLTSTLAGAILSEQVES